MKAQTEKDFHRRTHTDIYYSFMKAQHNIFDSHKHYDPFKAQDASLDPTNLKQHKRFNFNQGIQEEQLPYGTSYKKEPTIAYFQAKFPHISLIEKTEVQP